MGSVYQNRAIRNVSHILPTYTDAEIRQLVAGTYSNLFSSLPESIQSQVVQAIISAMTSVWTILMAAGALTVILALFLPVCKLHLLHLSRLSLRDVCTAEDKTLRNIIKSRHQVTMFLCRPNVLSRAREKRLARGAYFGSDCLCRRASLCTRCTRIGDQVS